MHLSSRAPTILLAGLAVIATVLLVAGYGIPVGVGVIVGAVFGTVWIAALLATRPRVTGSTSFQSWSSETRLSRQDDSDRMMRFHRDSLRVAGVDAGALQRVLPVASTIEAKGVRLDLVAIELREDGGIATLVSHSRPPIGMLGHFVEISVSDDLDTVYAASGQGSGGSNVGTARYEARFAPAPPAGARRLTLRVVRFTSPFGMEAAEVAGPWEFSVEV